MEIFKVQVSLIGSSPTKMVLAYNKDRSLQTEVPLTEDIKEMMGDFAKKFYYGTVVDDNIVLEGDEEAPWQDW